MPEPRPNTPPSVPRGITPEQEQAIIDFAAGGTSMSQTARELGLPQWKVRDWAKQNGVKWRKSYQTKAATEAAQAKLKERRAELAQKALDAADHIAERMYEPQTVTYNDIKGNFYREEVDTPDARMLRDYSAAMTSLLNSTDKYLDHVDKDINGESDVKAWLDFMSGNTITPREAPGEEPPKAPRTMGQ